MRQAKEDLLVMSAQNGNMQAFNVLFKQYHKPLLRFAFKMCRHESIAEDAVQEAWIKCASSIKRLNDPRAFKSWMYRTVRWRVIDQTRKLRSNESSLEDVNTAQFIEEPQSSDNGGDELKLLISELVDIDKQAIHLFYFEEMKISEIAIVLEIPPGTVKSRLNRARKQISEKLKNKLEDM